MDKIKLLSLLILAVGLLFAVKVEAQTKNPKPRKLVFSSVYTTINFDKCREIGKFDPAEPRDLPLLCKGYKDYKIFVSTHNRNTAYIDKNITENNIPEDAASFVIEQKNRNPVIEWRLANGVPFACIVRIEGDAQVFSEIVNEKGAVNYLIVKNLPGFKSFAESIDANMVKSANRLARSKADSNYSEL